MNRDINQVVIRQNQFVVCGLIFESIRFEHPIPHWRLKIPSGEIFDPGVGGIDTASRPKQKSSLEYLCKKIGEERFLYEFNRKREVG